MLYLRPALFKRTLPVSSFGSSAGAGAIERSIFGFIWKYSKRDQLILLAVTATLFPLLYLTLELPKRIINDAIGASSEVVEQRRVDAKPLDDLDFSSESGWSGFGAEPANGELMEEY